MPRHVLQLDHAKTFSDVIFGVIIGLPLAGFPAIVNELIMSPSSLAWTRAILLASAIIFCSFYWLELRRFIDEQKAFNDAIDELEPRADGIVSFTMTRFAGSLVIVIFAAATLKFAELNFFRAFLVANMLFWLLDLFGNIELNRVYRLHHNSMDKLLNQHPNTYEWFRGHLGTFFFYVYGLVNVAFFLSLLMMDNLFGRSARYRVIAATAVLAATLFRHLLWRARIYDWWRKRIGSENRQVPRLTKHARPQASHHQKRT